MLKLRITGCADRNFRHERRVFVVGPVLGERNTIEHFRIVNPVLSLFLRLVRIVQTLENSKEMLQSAKLNDKLEPTRNHRDATASWRFAN